MGCTVYHAVAKVKSEFSKLAQEDKHRISTSEVHVEHAEIRLEDELLPAEAQQSSELLEPGQSPDSISEEAGNDRDLDSNHLCDGEYDCFTESVSSIELFPSLSTHSDPTDVD